MALPTGMTGQTPTGAPSGATVSLTGLTLTAKT